MQVALAGLATVKLADAALPLWRPLAWNVFLRPGIVEPANPLGTVNEAVAWPLAVALAVASTVAPKVTWTRSEGVKPRQARVTRAPAGPLAGGEGAGGVGRGDQGGGRGLGRPSG
jgi:hypothetical protein